MKKIVSIVGTRPQFIKYGYLHSFMKNCKSVLVHTGQHYDYNMNDVFFSDMGIPEPDFNLGVGSNSDGVQIGKAITRIEPILCSEDPDYVLVFGDCNSTLSGAITGSKLGISVVHVESGLRCWDKSVPEEINRILVDQLSRVLFCPTLTSTKNLLRENISGGIFVGDIRKDILLDNISRCQDKEIYSKYRVRKNGFYLATVHRVENTNPVSLQKLLLKFSGLDKPVVFPVHPRTRNLLDGNGFDYCNLVLCDPVGYFEMLGLLKHCCGVYTDSGGLFVEGFLLGKPVFSLRSCHEYPEITANCSTDVFGRGNAARLICRSLGVN